MCPSPLRALNLKVRNYVEIVVEDKKEGNWGEAEKRRRMFIEKWMKTSNLTFKSGLVCLETRGHHDNLWVTQDWETSTILGDPFREQPCHNYIWLWFKNLCTYHFFCCYRKMCFSSPVLHLKCSQQIRLRPCGGQGVMFIC